MKKIFLNVVVLFEEVGLKYRKMSSAGEGESKEQMII